MKNSISKRIVLIINKLDMNINSFSKAIGLSNNVTIGRIINENREPSFQVLNKIVQTFGSINANWLIAGDGEMFITLDKGKEEIKITPPLSRTDGKQEESQCVPLYNIEATTGLVDLFSNSHQHIIDHIRVPNLPPCDGAVHVTGDNMYPLLKSGDIVLYKQGRDIVNDIFWGEMYLISVEVGGEEFIAVKYIQKSDVSDHVKLVSHNEHHQSKDVHLKKIQALAIVKASIRINSMR